MTSDTSGFLIWITGLAGSGKSTLGRELHAELGRKGLPSILLDGDQLREITGGVFGYSLEERRRCAEFYSRLCEILTQQGVNIICCTISMFEAVRNRNRSHIPRYFEIYLKADMALLNSRNQKKLYQGNPNVMGCDLAVEVPQHPDLTFDLGVHGLKLEEMARRSTQEIVKRFNRGGNEVLVEG